MASEVYLLWLLPLLQTLSAFGAELSSEACRELGFSSNLLCSSCDLLGQFSLTQLEPFCRQCCQQEAQLESRKVDYFNSIAITFAQCCVSSNQMLNGTSSTALSRSYPGGVWMKIGEVPSSPRFNQLYGALSVECTSFVRSDKPKMFRGLQIKYVRGSDPVLKLLDDNGNIAEELSILKWNTDSVEEFLGEKLDRI
ncbi:hypothetical protein NFI96_028515 [Prochilodus magdalenae]|nr:hypothetical protein NFI96_028515 [Prochilodus magdalenae]